MTLCMTGKVTGAGLLLNQNPTMIPTRFENVVLFNP